MDMDNGLTLIFYANLPRTMLHRIQDEISNLLSQKEVQLPQIQTLLNLFKCSHQSVFV